MPKGEFYDLGLNPKRVGVDEDKKMYPTLHIDTERLPAIKGMKIGESGNAEIKFKINGTSLEVQAIKFTGNAGNEKEGNQNGGTVKAGEKDGSESH